MAKVKVAKPDEAAALRREVESAVRDAEAAGVPLPTLLDRVAGTLGAQAHVRAVFGQQVSQGDVTVIPVARVVGAFGVGSDASEADRAGGGGAFVALPLGFIELRDGRASFRRLDDDISRFVGGKTGLAIELGSRALRYLSRRWKR